jgi:hypothetical protein
VLPAATIMSIIATELMSLSGFIDLPYSKCVAKIASV